MQICGLLNQGGGDKKTTSHILCQLSWYEKKNIDHRRALKRAPGLDVQSVYTSDLIDKIIQPIKPAFNEYTVVCADPSKPANYVRYKLAEEIF